MYEMNQISVLELASARQTDFVSWLREEEKSPKTIEKYARDLRAFFAFMGERRLDKDVVMEWKAELIKDHAPASVNSMLAAVNRFLEWAGAPQCRVRPLKLQRELFRRPEKELSRSEYLRLVKAADGKGDRRLSLVIQTICSTGIRVSELRYITAEAVKAGRAVVDCKGKTRTVFLPRDLCRLLGRFCREDGISSGPVFHTRGGMPLDRTNVWRDMKKLCREACVEPEKVFPHNLRHLFARVYYTLEKDLSKLADLLGHTNVSTTRIYTMESGREHARQLERMGLVFAPA